MECDHSNYDEYFDICTDCSMTRQQMIEEAAGRLIQSVTLPAIIEHRHRWTSAPDSTQKEYELAIADYAINNYYGSR